MAILQYEITGTVSGLASAANTATGILNSLQQTADNLKINLFSATTKSDIDAIGGALTIITGKIKEYTSSAIQGSQAFKDQTAVAALDSLANKLSVLTGNAQLFGTSIQNQQGQIRAYQSAIDKLLSAGFGPMDSRIVSLKGNIDALTASIERLKNDAKPLPPITPPPGLIEQAEKKIRDLGLAIRQATNVNDINVFNRQLAHARQELSDLNNVGLTAAQVQNRLAQSTRGAGLGFNQVGIELGRVIQDAPYAANNFGAIGNNITRIVEVLPGYLLQTRAVIVANGGVATSANVAKVALAGLFSGIGAISLAISAIVAGFVIYQQVQQANARAAAAHTDEIQKQKKALEDYITTLDASSRASAKAVEDYAQEATKLDVLYKSLIQNSNARYGNVSALEELQKSWPQEFGNLQKGANFVSTLSAEYEKLSFNIKQTGIAAAAQSLSAEATKKLVQNTVALADADRQVIEAQKEYNRLLNSAPDQAAQAIIASDISIGPDAITAAKKAFETAKATAAEFRLEAFKARQEIDKFNKASIDAQSKITRPVDSGLVYNLEREIKLLQDQQPFIKDKSLLEANVLAIKTKQAQLDALLGKNIKANNAELQRGLSLTQQLQAILDKSSGRVSESGLSGYALEIQKVTDFYKGLNTEIDNFVDKITLQNKAGTLSDKKFNSLLGIATAGKTAATGNQEQEVLDIRLKEVERVANEIQRINDQFGVKAEVSRQKEIAQIEARYNAEVIKAEKNSLILEALDNGRLAAIQAINDKYEAIQTDLYSKIATINDTANAAFLGKEEDATQKIQNEWNARKKAADEYFKKIKEGAATGIPAVDAFNNLILNAQQGVTNSNIAAGSEAEITRKVLEPLTSGLGRAVRQFGSDFFDTLTDVDTYAKGTFGSIFADLTGKLTASLNKVFLTVIVNGLADALQRAISSGTSGLTSVTRDSLGNITGSKITPLGVGIAAGGIAGGAISAGTSKTSTAGQALGGALSGAAAGATIGSIIPGLGTVIGGVIGAVVGGIAGIFKASAARKREEELLKLQLEEQKKQTEYQRQQLVAYTSQIIGRMTQNGIVTNVDLNSRGELVATVSGRDLQFVLDRNKNGR